MKQQQPIEPEPGELAIVVEGPSGLVFLTGPAIEAQIVQCEDGIEQLHAFIERLKAARVRLHKAGTLHKVPN